jgi:alpha-ribazole phosphatase
MEVYLIRHTRVDVAKEICYGQLNVPLAASFNDELSELIQKLPTAFDVVFSSDADRCLRLARIFSTEVIVSPHLRELHFGNWEGKNWDAINQEELNHWMQDFVHVVVPNGENLLQLSARVNLFFDQLRSMSYKRVLIVTHAGVLRCTRAYIEKMPLQHIFKIPVDYGEMLQMQLGKNAEEDRLFER